MFLLYNVSTIYIEFRTYFYFSEILTLIIKRTFQQMAFGQQLINNLYLVSNRIFYLL